MGIATDCARWLLFVFNFLFVLCGLALLIIGVLFHLKLKEATDVVGGSITFPTIGLIIIGAIIFTIAFFGCCGAIRESHCMIVTFAVLLLTILVLQLAIGIFAFVQMRGHEDKTIEESYQKSFNNYWTVEGSRQTVDFVQMTLDCCGVNSYKDFDSFNGTVPWSCCPHDDMSDKSVCTGKSNIYTHGCVGQINSFLKTTGKVLGGVAIGIAAVEFIGIIFALCLANAIRNAERRGYRV